MIVEIEIPELIEFLHQQLDDLPDTRKPGNNTRYQVEGIYSVEVEFAAYTLNG